MSKTGSNGKDTSRRTLFGLPMLDLDERDTQLSNFENLARTVMQLQEDTPVEPGDETAPLRLHPAMQDTD
ncbi:MAG: hypothetical protein R3228_04955 [Halioglobus sp.]|nr:hypothetical protein [Halioglobus sp.]